MKGAPFDGRGRCMPSRRPPLEGLSERERLLSVIIIALYSTIINVGWSARARPAAAAAGSPLEEEKGSEALPDMQ